MPWWGAKRAGLLMSGTGAALLAVILMLEGCQGGPRTQVGVVVPPDPPVTVARVSIQSGSLLSSGGCRFEYDLYRSDSGHDGAGIVLAHGFLRDRSRMEGLASALAASGWTTVTIDLCNMRAWDGAHRQNAADLRQAAAALGQPRVVYAGFSAGGLAALLAAADDPSAIGVLALDLVDQDGLGRRAAESLDRPIIGLFGDPSRCNAGNNGLAVLTAAGQGEVVRIAGATHCDFESPSDGLCRLLCEPATRAGPDAEHIREDIITNAVAAVWRLAGSAAARPTTTGTD